MTSQLSSGSYGDGCKCQSLRRHCWCWTGQETGFSLLVTCQQTQNTVVIIKCAVPDFPLLLIVIVVLLSVISYIRIICQYDSVCMCVCLWERERECVCVCACVRERERDGEREGERESVCVCERERECVRETETESMCVHTRASVCVCVCERERQRQRQRQRERERECVCERKGERVKFRYQWVCLVRCALFKENIVLVSPHPRTLASF